jgi:acyl-CoA synthetase (NDP forming)
MDYFFNPAGIALVGASANPLKGGNAILKNLIRGFSGGIYPVNPRYDEIEGTRCYPSVSAVPDPVDLAIVFVPANRVPDVIRACADRGIRGVMIESGGFAETGPEGAALQDQLTSLAAETGIRLWGPNCMGLVDTVRRHVFSFVSPVIWETGLTPSPVSLIVQSGMLSGAFLIDLMTHGVMGISKVCSIGNKIDVDECELLEYLINDPDTGVIGLYLEAIPEGRRFMDLCRCSEKPVVILKGGRSAVGSKAAMSHTASLAGDGAVIDGAFAQAGVIPVSDFKEMTDVCRSLAAFPDLPAGASGRVAVLTYTGGAGIVSADLMEPRGLSVAGLSEETRSALATVFPDWMPVSNPVDLWPAVERNGAETTYNASVKAVCADPSVDAVLIHAFAGGFALNPDLETIVGAARTAGKPIFCWLLGSQPDAETFRDRAQALGMPVFGELDRAVRCMAALFDHHRSLDRTRRPAPSSGSESFPEDLAADLPAGAGVLDELDAKRLLAKVGVPVVAEQVIESADAAADAAETLGYPVVAKGLVPGAIHKTEGGLVRLGLGSAEAVREAVDALIALAGDRGRVILQAQVQGEIELIAGLIRDPQFGPCVMCGFGGVLAEAIGDVRFALAPLSLDDAFRLIDRLRGQTLLNGFRGAPPVDREALARILVSIGNLGAALPRITEIDVNPLMIAAGQPVAVDATVVVEGAEGS